MGNMIKSQIKFTNFTFPKLKPTQPPTPIGNKAPHSQSIRLYIDNYQKDNKQNHFPLYHFGSKTKFNIEQYQLYRLPSSLTVLSYNIWFEEHNSNNRNQCILKLLEISNADFICLQEVTQGFIQKLHGLPTNGWIRNYYTAVIPMGWYDTVILTKYKCKFYKIPFNNSFMGRNMIFAQLVEAEGRNIIVGCMHYESLNGNQKIRQQQIQAVQKVTQHCQRVIIVGDYNFSDGYDQNKVIDKKYTDLWAKLRKLQQDRYTMPQSKKFSAWRPDHILCKVPESVNLNQAQIYKFGDFTIPPFEKDQYHKIGIDDIVRTPSDHFGLVAWIPIQ